MKKYDLFRNDDTIIRVLEIKPDRVLVIDCIKKTMPVWVALSALNSFRGCTDDELAEVTDVTVTDIDTLDAEQRKIMYDRYTLIAPILPFVADEKMRSRLICSMATEQVVSKQTIRNYLCLYLTYMDVAVLAPKKKSDNVQLAKGAQTKSISGFGIYGWKLSQSSGNSSKQERQKQIFVLLYSLRGA